MKKARVFLVRGRVQGVGFRFFAQHVAAEIGLKGYVRNLSGGGVEVYATGGEEALKRLREELERGPGRVEDIQEQDAPWKRYTNFSIEASS